MAYNYLLKQGHAVVWFIHGMKKYEKFQITH